MIWNCWTRSGSPPAGAPGSRPTTCWARWRPRERDDRWSWSAATATCCRWWPTIPSRFGCSTSAVGWPRPTCSGPPRWPNNTVCRWKRAGPAYAELAMLRGDPSDGLPGCAGRRREDRRHAAGSARLAGADPGRRPRPEVRDGQGRASETAGRGWITSRRPARWCGWPRMRRHAVDGHRRTTAGRRRSAAHRRTGDRARRRLVDQPACRKRSTRCPGGQRTTTAAGRPRRCPCCPGRSRSRACARRRC